MSGQGQQQNKNAGQYAGSSSRNRFQPSQPFQPSQGATGGPWGGIGSGGQQNQFHSDPYGMGNTGPRSGFQAPRMSNPDPMPGLQLNPQHAPYGGLQLNPQHSSQIGTAKPLSVSNMRLDLQPGDPRLNPSYNQGNQFSPIANSGFGPSVPPSSNMAQGSNQGGNWGGTQLSPTTLGFLGGQAPSATANGYNPDQYAGLPSWQISEAHKAAGSPTRDALGRPLDPRGKPVQNGYTFADQARSRGIM